ncbi:MAG TPA: hypothetical protein VF482_20380 [Trebonia sp.]
MDHPLAGGPDYFATYDFTEEWTKGGQTMLMRFWHRPLHAMTDAFRAAGFTLDVISEPQPDPVAESLFPAAASISLLTDTDEPPSGHGSNNPGC